MDARLAKADAAFLLPSAAADQREALRLAAGRAFESDLAHRLRRAADALFGWSARARVRHELMALTDRELADIGLTRGDIGRVVAGTLHRRGA